MKNTECLGTYLVKYTHSLSRNGAIHNDWRIKYLGCIGCLYILNNGRQYFQWHPMNRNNELLLNKGMVSTNDDVTISGSTIKVTTVNSKYYFTIIKKLKTQLPEIIW